MDKLSTKNMRQYNKEYYLKNRKKRLEKQKEYQRKHKKQVREYKKQHYIKNQKKILTRIKERHLEKMDKINQIKQENGCEECGMKNPICLDFHHKNPKTKRFTISFGLNRGFPLKRIMKEIKKCRIICRNCHAVEHSKLWGV